MQDHLTKLNNKKIVVPESVRTVTDDLKIMGERQWETFIHDRWFWVRYQYYKKSP